MTLYLSRRKLFGAWLLFLFGLLLTLATMVLTAILSSSKSSTELLFWVLCVPCLGVTWLGMYALEQIYSCPRCGKCIIRDVLFAQLGRKTQTTCPDCVRSIDIVMER